MGGRGGATVQMTDGVKKKGGSGLRFGPTRRRAMNQPRHKTDAACEAEGQGANVRRI